MSGRKISRKITFYTVFSVFIIWIVIEPGIILSFNDAILIIFFVVLTHSWIDNRYLYSKLSLKYKNQTKLLNNIFLNCPDLVYHKDSRLKYKDCNPIMRKMLNLNDNETIFNKTDYDLYPKETAKIIRTYDRQVLETGRVVSYKIEKQLPNKETKIYDTLLAPVTNEREIIGVIGILRDTTQVEALKEKMLIQNAQLESILNNMPYLVYIKDVNGNLIFCNKHISEQIKQPVEKIVGTNLTQTYFPEMSDEIKSEDKKVIEHRKTIVIERKLIAPFQEKPGWFQISKSPIIDSKDNVVSIIVMIKNIDNEKMIEAQKENLVATITHDLKNPTNAQLGAMNLLLDEKCGELNEEQREMIQLTKNSNIYMHNMISTILTTYKSECEEMKPNPELFNFFDMVHITAKEIANLALTRNQNIIIMSRLKNEKVTADPLQMKRAVTNLLGNAITYGFEKTDIIVNLEEKDDKITFNVINRGHYISEEKLGEIFEKYKTSENAKFNKASTGLGLYLSRKIVRRHKGEIYAKSFKNQTCIFGFTIPRTMLTAQETPELIS